MNTRWILSVIVAPLALGACATTPPSAPEDPDIARGSDCLNSRLLRSFEAFDDKHVYVREGRDKHFLITTRGVCLDLRYAMTVAVSDTTSRVCSNGLAKLVYRDGLSGPMQSCYIDSVQPVASKEHAQAYIDQRAGRPSPQIEGKWEELPEE